MTSNSNNVNSVNNENNVNKKEDKEEKDKIQKMREGIEEIAEMADEANESVSDNLPSEEVSNNESDKELANNDEIEDIIANFDTKLDELIEDPDNEYEKIMNTSYIVSKDSKEAIGIAASLNNLKHGLYAHIPILCHADNCPYSGVCKLNQMDKAPEGDQCPVEIALINDLMQKYYEEFDIQKDDAVDATMIRNLINIDVQIVRSIKRQAVEGDIISHVVVGVSEDGEPIRRPEINVSYDLQEKLMNRRERILRMLNSTRKDKAQEDKLTDLDPSQLVNMMKERLEKHDDSVIDVDGEDVDEDDIEEEVIVEDN